MQFGIFSLTGGIHDRDGVLFLHFHPLVSEGGAFDHHVSAEGRHGVYFLFRLFFGFLWSGWVSVEKRTAN